jgi:hypothetical protein
VYDKGENGSPFDSGEFNQTGEWFIKELNRKGIPLKSGTAR